MAPMIASGRSAAVANIVTPQNKLIANHNFLIIRVPLSVMCIVNRCRRKYHNTADDERKFTPDSQGRKPVSGEKTIFFLSNFF